MKLRLLWIYGKLQANGTTGDLFLALKRFNEHIEYNIATIASNALDLFLWKVLLPSKITYYEICLN